jgi:NTE family protein
MPAYEAFTLGGPFRLSAYHVNQFAGREYAYGRLVYYNRVLPLPDILGTGLFTGGALEAGRMNERFSGLPDTGTLYSGSLFLGADTFLGPAYLGVGVGKDRTWSVYLLLGAP